MNFKRASTTTCGIGLAIAASCAAAQTTANGPYYATPSWDQTMPVATRFVVLANFNSEAVLDRETGLVWERTPLTQSLPYANAAEQCIQTSTGGRYGWRLPSINELTSLFDTTARVSPFLPSGHPFNVAYATFWSSSSVPGSAAPARYIANSFSVAPGVSLFRAQPFAENANAPAWCVRAQGSSVAHGG